MQAGMNGAAQEEPDARWMSYTELAEARKISASSAVKLVVRRGWRRQKDNHGTTRALVPPDWISPAPGKDFDPGAHLNHAIAALEFSVSTLRERAEAAERAATAERERANRATEARDAERSRANVLRDKIDALGLDLASAQTELQTAQSELFERDRDAACVRDTQARWRSAGLIERLLWAWRGILPNREAIAVEPVLPGNDTAPLAVAAGGVVNESVGERGRRVARRFQFLASQQNAVWLKGILTQIRADARGARR